MDAEAIKPNAGTGVGQRLVSVEPMVRLPSALPSRFKLDTHHLLFLSSLSSSRSSSTLECQTVSKPSTLRTSNGLPRSESTTSESTRSKARRTLVAIQKTSRPQTTSTSQCPRFLLLPLLAKRVMSFSVESQANPPRRLILQASQRLLEPELDHLERSRLRLPSKLAIRWVLNFIPPPPNPLLRHFASRISHPRSELRPIHPIPFRCTITTTSPPHSPSSSCYTPLSPPSSSDSSYIVLLPFLPSHLLSSSPF
jgi:hypothetical protein